MTHSVDEAVQHFLDFYKNFRSYRWVGARMVIRLTHQLTAGALAQLNEQFDDILKTPTIVQTEALPEEANEPELAPYPRLVLTPHQRNFGRLRQFIDAVNASEVEPDGEGREAG
jgi:NAD(P)H-hydrate repair Nnr-like enzyme with NAD(P)H-hydrate dehydratase domain